MATRTVAKTKAQAKEAVERGQRLAAQYGVEYLLRLPSVLPDDGRVLVHNQVQPALRPGTRGFRAWLQVKDETLELCPCRWASKLGPHYRKRFIGMSRQ